MGLWKRRQRCLEAASRRMTNGKTLAREGFRPRDAMLSKAYDDAPGVCKKGWRVSVHRGNSGWEDIIIKTSRNFYVEDASILKFKIIADQFRLKIAVRHFSFYSLIISFQFLVIPYCFCNFLQTYFVYLTEQNFDTDSTAGYMLG